MGPRVDEIFFCDATSENGQMIGFPPDEITAPCPLPFFRLHVSAEGYLRMCCNDDQNYLSLVDLNHTSLRDAWYSPIFREMRRRHLENRLEGPLCHNCIHNANTPIVPSLAVEVAPEFFVFRK